MKKKVKLCCLILFVILNILVSCKEMQVEEIESVEFVNQRYDLYIGDIIDIELNILPDGFKNAELKFWVSDSSVILEKDNKIYALKEGTAVIYVEVVGHNLEASSIVNVKKPSAYDLLTLAEKDIYHAILLGSVQFKNPSSVRLIETTGMNWETELGFGYFHLSATNGFGATTSGYYSIWIENKDTLFYIREISDSKYKDAEFVTEYNVTKVNNALNEYWNNL